MPLTPARPPGCRYNRLSGTLPEQFSAFKEALAMWFNDNQLVRRRGCAACAAAAAVNLMPACWR